MGAWVWEPLAVRLRAYGYDVHALTLSGLSGGTDASKIRLETHVVDVMSFIELAQLDQVVLVAHSYSGIIAAIVAGRLPGRVVHTIFVKACLLVA